MNSFRRMISVILGFLLMFVASQLYFSLKQDVLTQEVIKQETIEFTDTISEHGEITEFSMNQFLTRLSNTCNVYQIDVLHEKLNQEPEYRFRTVDEIMEAQKAAYEGENVYTYREVQSEKPTVSNQEPNNLIMNSETNASVLSSSVATSASSAHVHSSACYASSSDSTEIYVVLNGYSNLGGTYTSETYQVYCDHCGEVLYSLSYVMNERGTSGVADWDIRIGLSCGEKEDPETEKYISITSHTSNYYSYSTGYGTNADKFLFSMYDTLISANYVRRSITYSSTSIKSVYIWETTWSEFQSLVIANGYQGEATVGDATIQLWESCPYSCNTTYMTSSTKCSGYMKMIGYVGDDYELNLLQDGYSGGYVENTYTSSSPIVRWAIYQCTSCGDYLLQVYYPNSIYTSNTDYPPCYLVSLDGADYTSEQLVTKLKGLKEYIEERNLIYYGHSPDYFYLSETDIWNAIKTYLQQLSHAQLVDLEDSPYYKLPNHKTCTRSTGRYTDADGTTTCSVIFIDRDMVSGTSGVNIISSSTVYNLAKHYVMAQGVCMCDQIIRSLTPTHAIQNIYCGDQMHFITTATVTYLDGSTEVVICDSTFQANTVGNNQTATLTYTGYYSSTQTKTFSTTVTVNVVAKSKTCSNGHTYWLSEDGTDPGCPFCDAWLRSLTLVTPSNGILEITQGTSLEENGVKLLATYLNGDRAYVTSGYVDNLDTNYIGTQTVTIGYKGCYVSLQVTTKYKQKQCPNCKNYYDLNPDGTDPGCPYCLSLIPIFTGNVMSYYTEFTTDEIMKEINTNGSYQFSVGDEITFHIYNKNDTLAAKLLSFFGYGNTPKINIWVTTEIREES